MTAAPDLRPTADAPDDDPYLWLEEIDGARALAWVAAENARTRDALSGADWRRDRDLLCRALDRPDRIPAVTRRAGLLYNFWTDAEHKRGVWRRTTLASYRTDTPNWDVLLDLDALAAAENEDWVWHGATTLPPHHDRTVLHLSRGGGDAVTLREFDLDARRFVPDGFNLSEAKSDLDWLDRDTVLLASAHGGSAMATTSGYARTIRVWRRGENPDAAPVLFECAADHVAAGAGLDRSAPDGAERIVFFDSKSFFSSTIHLGDRSGPRQRLDVPEDARTSFQGDHLLVRPRTPWTLDGRTHAPDTVLAFSLSRFLSGEREPTILFEPEPRTAIQSAFFVSGRAVLAILDELRPVSRILAPPADPDAPAGTPWTATAIPGLPEAGVVSVHPLDTEETESDGTLLVNAQDPITPPTLFLSSVSGAAPAILRRAPATFDASGLAVTRLEAVAADGERIPYVVTAPAGVVDGSGAGDAPVHLTGYGGFAVSTLPYYGTRTGVLWLQRGGTGVVANIRGGGEFGTRWHEAGRGTAKRVSHDDFAAVAADLAQRGITRPERIAAEGGSNGGLLIANMWTRHPEKFGALFCTIPLCDMRRYTLLLAGASWIAEYGNPADEADWEHLRHVSAYHAAAPAAPGIRVPPILVATTRRDDRVHPGHARKFAAKLRALGAEVLFHEPEAGGHGFGADNEQVAAFAALGALFLRRSIGWDA
ncbi:MAG: S9 family peptidase [Gluconacetobacter diazotrophicus]|nr:S9 family peptidase [Gluconacetobacter diazotrophicus]